MTRVAWHRIFHPLAGADPVTLARLLVRAGPPSWRGALPLAVAVASSLGRLPFTLAEAGWAAATRQAHAAAPVFIVGYPRSGTTHLHNLLAASGQFSTVPPVLAGLPWEARGLARALRPFIDMYLPETRLIDAVRLDPDSPTEDEVALANMCDLSYFHAIYFPRHFRRDYLRGLTFGGASARQIGARGRALARYVATMGRRDVRPLLLKNPAYTAQLGWLRGLFPEARIIHIHRDPRDVFASNARTLRTVLRELALQPVPEDEIDAAILEAYPHVMDRLLSDIGRLPPDCYVEIAFERLAADPAGAMRELWQRLGLPAERESLAAIERYRAGISGYRVHGAGSGAQPLAVAERWRPYLDRFGAPPAES